MKQLPHRHRGVSAREIRENADESKGDLCLIPTDQVLSRAFALPGAVAKREVGALTGAAARRSPAAVGCGSARAV